MADPDKMERELLPCPFCGADMELVSNRDWHRVLGHVDGCIIECEDAMTPATDEQRALLVADWNRRPSLLTAPPGYVLVPVELIDAVPEINPSNYDHDAACKLNAWACELATAAAPEVK